MNPVRRHGRIAAALIPTILSFGKLLKWFLNIVGWSTIPEDFMSLLDKVDQLPWVVLLTLTCAAWFFYFAGPALWRNFSHDRSETGPNYERWDDNDPLRVFDAAHLWIEEEPPKTSEGPSPKANAIFQHLHNQIDQGNLLVVREISSAVGATRWVARTSLKALAVRKGERPKFLYPEDR